MVNSLKLNELIEEKVEPLGRFFVFFSFQQNCGLIIYMQLNG